MGATLAEVEADGSESPFVVAAFRLLILTGCRLGEIQTLRWDYITPKGMEFARHKDRRAAHKGVVGNELHDMRSGVVPENVKTASHVRRSRYASRRFN